MYEEKRFSKLLLNRLHFANNLTWVMILVSIAFQRYIASPIWSMMAEVQPSTWRSSGRTTQAVKLQKKRNFITTREQNPPTSEIPILNRYLLDKKRFYITLTSYRTQLTRIIRGGSHGCEDSPKVGFVQREVLAV